MCLFAGCELVCTYEYCTCRAGRQPGSPAMLHRYVRAKPPSLCPTRGPSSDATPRCTTQEVSKDAPRIASVQLCTRRPHRQIFTHLPPYIHGLQYPPHLRTQDSALAACRAMPPPKLMGPIKRAAAAPQLAGPHDRQRNVGHAS